MNLYCFPFPAMGSPCEIQLYAESLRQAKSSARRAMEDVKRLEARYSRYRPESFLSEINRVAACGGTIEVDAETASLLDYAATCFHESDGLFDVTSGLLRQAWRFNCATLPDETHIAGLLRRIGWQHVRWQPPQLQFLREGMELDLGGVVKEYAADRIATMCREDGITAGYANLGGDIRIIGPRPDGTSWRVGIRNPSAATESIRVLEIGSGAVASSGDYERCIEVNGKRFGHILNPRSGWPTRYLAAVSVVADFCVVAGSAATIAILKETDGPTWLAQTGLPHLWVTVEGEVGGNLSAAGQRNSDRDSEK